MNIGIEVNDMEIKTVGFIRRMDDLGRVVIPKECRMAIGMIPDSKWGCTGAGEAFEVFAVEDGFYLKRRIDLKDEV
jgi:bifunctional DNA-binding transcriptional regulator/antitoxin component of YhaV-PrlF toxin-antitoxin module